MALLGAMIMIAWGNFIRNYVLRWLIATVVYYIPFNKEIDFSKLAILDFFNDGLMINVQGIINNSAFFIPIEVELRDLLIFETNASKPFLSITLSNPIRIGSQNIHLNQEISIKILNNDRFREFACRGILGMKQLDLRVEACGDFDFWLLKVSNLALTKYICSSKVGKELKLIPEMTFKPTPVVPSL